MVGRKNISESRDIPASLKRAITEFDARVQEYAFIGMQMPEDHPAIEQAYRDSRTRLEQKIAAAIKKGA